ncbi:MAG TPA: hypothetical protein VM163_03400 [bacterium]|nr:hypothetical protein [bacterium]
MELKNKIVVWALMSLLVAALSGCGGGGEKFGAEITIVETTKVGDILARPDDFAGKTVKIEGQITRECPGGHWLDVKDETGVTYVDLGPSGIVLPQKVGSRVTVEGKVLKRPERTMIIGKGVEIE